MKQVEIVVLGGCHVAGYPVGQHKAFSTLLGEILHGEVVAQVPNLQFVRLPEHLAIVGALRPSHVVLQLGNYEFSASLQCLLRQFSRSFGTQPAAKGNDKTAASSKASAIAKAAEPASRLARCARVAGLGLLMAVLWVCSAAHRRSFRALNACMRQYPGTAFIFLSPFPCLGLAGNSLRNFGGWLLRSQLAILPNRHWLNSHQLLRPGPRLFVDQTHLSKRGHRALAHGVAAACYAGGR